MKLQHVSIHGHDVGFHTAGEGPVLLLVHGMAGSSTTWKHVMPHLARRFTVVAPDLLGHGKSAKPRGEYSLGTHANILRDLLNVLGHERATLVGQSLGGGVVMQLAYQFPERCERLVLVGSGGLGPEVNIILRGADRSRSGVRHPARLAGRGCETPGPEWAPGSAAPGFGWIPPSRRCGGAWCHWPRRTPGRRSFALCAPWSTCAGRR